MTVDVFDVIQSELSVKELVVTAASADGAERQVATRRLAPNRFTAAVTLAHGRNTITVITRPRQGPRLRGAFDLDVP